MKKFSVIIPAYNCANTILYALQSIEKQTQPELVGEVIVVDDGSTDHTAITVQKFMADTKLNVKLIQQKNSGPSAARNAGLRTAVCEYIAFLDADDAWEACKLQKQAGVWLAQPQADLICGGMQEGPLKILIKKHTQLYRLSLHDYCWKSCIYTSTVAVRRARLADAGFFDETMKYCEDMNWFMRFFRWNQVYYLPEKLVRYGENREYYGQSGLSSKLKEMHLGREKNYTILRKERQISFLFYSLMVLFGKVKYTRRRILVQRGRRKNHE